MKTKKIDKKLNLNKITINTMVYEHLDQVNGGTKLSIIPTRCGENCGGETEYAGCTIMAPCRPPAI